MVKQILKWGGRLMTKAETETLDQALDVIAVEIAKLAEEITEIAQGIKKGIEYQKEFHKSLLELNDLRNLEKGLEKVKMMLLKKSPEYVIHGVLKGQLQQKDIVQLMESLYKEQKQRAEELPQDIKELLKGKLTPSQFVLKKRLEAERRGS